MEMLGHYFSSIYHYIQELEWSERVYLVGGVTAVCSVIVALYFHRRAAAKKRAKSRRITDDAIGRKKAIVNKRHLQAIKRQIEEHLATQEEEGEEDEATGSSDAAAKPKAMCIGGPVKDPFLFTKLAEKYQQSKNPVKQPGPRQSPKSTKDNLALPKVERKPSSEWNKSPCLGGKVDDPFALKNLNASLSQQKLTTENGEEKPVVEYSPKRQQLQYAPPQYIMKQVVQNHDVFPDDFNQENSGNKSLHDELYTDESGVINGKKILETNDACAYEVNVKENTTVEDIQDDTLKCRRRSNVDTLARQFEMPDYLAKQNEEYKGKSKVEAKQCAESRVSKRCEWLNNTDNAKLEYQEKIDGSIESSSQCPEIMIESNDNKSELPELSSANHGLKCEFEELGSENDVLKTRSERFSSESDHLESQECFNGSDYLKSSYQKSMSEKDDFTSESFSSHLSVTESDDLICLSQEIIEPCDDLKYESEELTSPSDDLKYESNKLTIPCDYLKCDFDELTSPCDDLQCELDKSTITCEDLKCESDELTSPCEDLKHESEEKTSTCEDIKCESGELMRIADDEQDDQKETQAFNDRMINPDGTSQCLEEHAGVQVSDSEYDSEAYHVIM